MHCRPRNLYIVKLEQVETRNFLSGAVLGFSNGQTILQENSEKKPTGIIGITVLRQVGINRLLKIMSLLKKIPSREKLEKWQEFLQSNHNISSEAGA